MNYYKNKYKYHLYENNIIIIGENEKMISATLYVMYILLTVQFKILKVVLKFFKDKARITGIFIICCFFLLYARKIPGLKNIKSLTDISQQFDTYIYNMLNVIMPKVEDIIAWIIKPFTSHPKEMAVKVEIGIGMVLVILFWAVGCFLVCALLGMCALFPYCLIPIVLDIIIDLLICFLGK